MRSLGMARALISARIWPPAAATPPESACQGRYWPLMRNARIYYPVSSAHALINPSMMACRRQRQTIRFAHLANLEQRSQDVQHTFPHLQIGPECSLRFRRRQIEDHARGQLAML
jgi:hypothetical protein